MTYDLNKTGAQIDAILTKVDGIEASADVTDATNVDAAGAVMESDYNAQTILAATADNTPTALTVAEQKVVGRVTGGNVAALSMSGADATVISGTAGTSGNIASWNADGDLVDSTVAVSAIGGKIANVVEDTTPQLGGNLDLNAKGIFLAGQTVGGSDGNLVYVSSADTWSQTDASAEATAKGMLGIRLSSTTVLTHGIFTTSGLTAGAIYYMSETAGAITATAPTTSGSIVRVAGHALSTTQLYLAPDGTYFENA